MFRLLVLLMLLFIVGSLFSGLFLLYRDRGAGSRTVRALAWRVGLSLLLFALLLAAFRSGLVPADRPGP